VKIYIKAFTAIYIFSKYNNNTINKGKYNNNIFNIPRSKDE